MSKTIEIRVPDIGDFKDIPVIEVLVKEGDRVQAEAGLVTLESDKATMEVPTPAAGTIREFRLKLGDAVSGDADSVLLQVTARRASSAGTLTFWRPGGARPGTVDLSVAPGQTVTGTVVAGIGDGRSVRVRNSGAKGVDVRITVLGAFR